MNKEDKLKKLDSLREEKRTYDYFISGNGNFSVRTEMKLFKFFGCGTHEMRVSDEQTRLKIFKVLKDRKDQLDTEINTLLGL